MSNRLKDLHDAGISIWLDFIERTMVHDGDLERRVRDDALTGMTSNPTIFEKALASGTAYDAQLRDAPADLSPLQLFELVETTDVRDACDRFRGVYDATDGYDGYVSIEVSPGAAHDTDATVEEAHRLWKAVDRPNVMIKVPGTERGAEAVRRLIADGINVNITLLFALEAHDSVIHAYMDGLEARVKKNQPIGGIASVASFFVSRVDTEVDARLDAIGNGKSEVGNGKSEVGNGKSEVGNGSEREPSSTDFRLPLSGFRSPISELRGKAAIANAKLAYALCTERFAGTRWQALEAKGGRMQRPLWASTSTKNPAYRDVMYVEQLVGPNCVNTLPPATVEAFRDHGEVRRTVDTGVDEARQVIAALEAAGVSMRDVTDKLLVDGLASFQKSFDSLLEGIARKRELVTTR